MWAVPNGEASPTLSSGPVKLRAAIQLHTADFATHVGQPAKPSSPTGFEHITGSVTIVLSPDRRRGSDAPILLQCACRQRPSRRRWLQLSRPRRSITRDFASCRILVEGQSRQVLRRFGIGPECSRQCRADAVQANLGVTKLGRAGKAKTSPGSQRRLAGDGPGTLPAP